MAAARDSVFSLVRSDNNKVWPVFTLVVALVLGLSFYQFQTQSLKIAVGKPVVKVTTIDHPIKSVGLMPERLEKN